MRDTRAVDLPRCHSDRRGWAECEAAGRADATAGGTSPAPSCAAAEVRVSGMQGKALRQQRLAQNSRPGQAVCTTRSDRFRAVPCGTGRGQCRVRAARTARASVPAVHTRAREREPWRPGRSTPRRPRTARHGSHYSSRHAPSRPAPAARAAVRKVTQLSLPPRGVGRECESRLAGARPALQRAGQQEARTARAR